MLFFFSSRRRHTRCSRDWSSDVCSSDLFVCEPQHVAGAPSPSEDGRGRVLHTAIGEVAQERVAGAERKKTEGSALAVGGPGKQAVDDLVGGAVAAYGEKLAIATRMRLAHQLRGFARAAALAHLQRHPSPAQLLDGARRQPAGTAAARREGNPDHEG